MKRLRTAVIGIALVLVIAVTVVAVGYELLNQGDMELIGDAVYRAYNPASASGSGVFDAFVRVGGKGAIRGYNSDSKPLEFDTKDGLTRAILLSEIPVVTDTVDLSIEYREVQLDINQTSGADISLDEVEFYLTDSPLITGYPFGTEADLIYELDATEDNWVVLNYDLAAGSGKRDLILRVPDSYFQGSSYGYCD